MARTGRRLIARRFRGTRLNLLRLRRLLRLNLLVMLVNFMTGNATPNRAQHCMMPRNMPNHRTGSAS